MILPILASRLIIPPPFRNWPALVVGVAVAAYWWRVTRMAIKMRRKTGRGANFVPTEPLGRALRLLWQPVVWVWIAQPFVAAVMADPPAPLRPLFAQPALQWIAALVAWSAFVATRICWKRMGKSWRMGIDPNERTELVVTGPYALVRHPIYALSSVLMIATVVAVPTPLIIVAAFAHLLLLQWEARREEQHLLRIHGDAYQQYLDSVGRFVPRTSRRYSPAAASASASASAQHA
jgi:protein-S-isoprenylcysteine O-methyltransferase Ste14